MQKLPAACILFSHFDFYDRAVKILVPHQQNANFSCVHFQHLHLAGKTSFHIEAGVNTSEISCFSSKRSDLQT